MRPATDCLWEKVLSRDGRDTVVIDDGGGSGSGSSQSSGTNAKSGEKGEEKKKQKSASSPPTPPPAEGRAAFDPGQNPEAALPPPTQASPATPPATPPATDTPREAQCLEKPTQQSTPTATFSIPVTVAPRYPATGTARSGSGRAFGDTVKKGDAGGIVTIGDMVEGNAWSSPATSISELRRRAAQTQNPLAALLGNSAIGGAITGGAALVGAGGTLAKGVDSTVRGFTDKELSDKLNQLSEAKGKAILALRHGDAGAAQEYGADIARLRGEVARMQEEREAAALRNNETPFARAANRLDAAYEDLNDRGGAYIAEARRGQDAVGRLLSDVTVAGTQTFGDALANAALPGSGLVMLGARSFGDASQQARKSGASVGEQFGYGISTAATEVLSEKLFDGLAGVYGRGVADDVTKGIVNRFGKTKGGRAALRILTSMGGEAAEEVVAGAVEPTLGSIYNGRDVRDNYSGETLADVGYSALVAAILGAVGGAAKTGNAYAALIQQLATERSGVENGGTSTFATLDELVQGMSASTRDKARIQSDVDDVKESYAALLRAQNDPTATPEQLARLAQSVIDRANWASGQMDEISSFGAGGKIDEAQRILEDVIGKAEPWTAESLQNRIELNRMEQQTDSFYIGKSLGSKAKNYQVVDKETGIEYHFVEGTRIENPTVFAGYKGVKSLNPETVNGLVSEYGGSPKKWQHLKGIGILDADGDELKAEVHWFQEESVGKVKFKVKRWLE